MPQDPAAIQQQIENTRAELAGTIDAIADLISPKRVVERTGEQIRGRMADLRHKVITSGFGAPQAVTTGPGGEVVAFGDERDLQPEGRVPGLAVRRSVRWDRVTLAGVGVLVLTIGVRRRRRRRMG